LKKACFEIALVDNKTLVEDERLQNLGYVNSVTSLENSIPVLTKKFFDAPYSPIFTQFSS
jgi:hypothetical protein